jgi:hypothetical protein
VAFARAPDLHTAAHEAAHVVQQRGGVQLAGGVGREGDVFEQHADRVADLVVQGRSAESTLDALAGSGAGGRAVQRIPGQEENEVQPVEEKKEGQEGEGQKQEGEHQEVEQQEKPQSERQKQLIEKAKLELAEAETNLEKAKRRRGNNDRVQEAITGLQEKVAGLEKDLAAKLLELKELKNQPTQNREDRKALNAKIKLVDKQIDWIRDRKRSLREGMEKLKAQRDSEKKVKQLDKRVSDAESRHRDALKRLESSHTVDEREEKLQREYGAFELAYANYLAALDRFTNADPNSPDTYLQAFGELSHALNECNAINERLRGIDTYGVSEETRKNQWTASDQMFTEKQGFKKVIDDMSGYHLRVDRQRFSQEKGATEKVAKLRFNVLVAGPQISLSNLIQARLGHSWISLWFDDETHVPLDLPPPIQGRMEATAGKKEAKIYDTFGFYPDSWRDEQGQVQGGISYNPFNSYVPGHVSTPDQQFAGREKASQTWEITQDQARAVLAYVVAHAGAQYSFFHYNCTTFASEAVAAGGESAPENLVGGVAVPTEVFESIRKLQNSGEGTTMVMDFESGQKVKYKDGQPKPPK